MSDVIALIFDFDDTLASDSTSGFLDSIGVDTASFWKEEVDPLLFQQDWDPVPAYLYKMIELSRQGRHGLITQQRLKDWGARLDLHDGVATLFQRLRAAVRAEHPQVQLEFYLISSGIGDVVRSTPIAHEFTEIWASEFVYGGTAASRFRGASSALPTRLATCSTSRRASSAANSATSRSRSTARCPRTDCASHSTRWSSSATATPTFRAFR